MLVNTITTVEHVMEAETAAILIWVGIVVFLLLVCGLVIYKKTSIWCVNRNRRNNNNNNNNPQNNVNIFDLPPYDAHQARARAFNMHASRDRFCGSVEAEAARNNPSAGMHEQIPLRELNNRNAPPNGQQQQQDARDPTPPPMPVDMFDRNVGAARLNPFAGAHGPIPLRPLINHNAPPNGQQQQQGAPAPTPPPMPDLLNIFA